MHEPDTTLISRLDALGARAGEQAPPAPAALLSAVSTRAPRPSRVPLPALAAAVAVIAAGGALVVFGLPAPNRHTGGTVISSSIETPVTLLSMMVRYNKLGTIDAAVSSGSGAAAAGGPVYRATDARTGELPE